MSHPDKYNILLVGGEHSGRRMTISCNDRISLGVYPSQDTRRLSLPEPKQTDSFSFQTIEYRMFNAFPICANPKDSWLLDGYDQAVQIFIPIEWFNKYNSHQLMGVVMGELFNGYYPLNR